MDNTPSVDQISPEQVIENEPLITHAKRRFYASDVCREARERLQALVDSPEYNTDPALTTSDPVPFVERHLNHLSMYPNTNLDGYISNLKLMTNAKRSRPAR